MQEMPGTRMAFVGIKNDNDIGNLWAYLKQFEATARRSNPFADPGWRPRRHPTPGATGRRRHAAKVRDGMHLPPCAGRPADGTVFLS